MPARSGPASSKLLVIFNKGPADSAADPPGTTIQSQGPAGGPGQVVTGQGCGDFVMTVSHLRLPPVVQPGGWALLAVRPPGLPHMQRKEDPAVVGGRAGQKHAEVCPAAPAQPHPEVAQVPVCRVPCSPR